MNQLVQQNQNKNEDQLKISFEESQWNKISPNTIAEDSNDQLEKKIEQIKSQQLNNKYKPLKKQQQTNLRFMDIINKNREKSQQMNRTKSLIEEKKQNLKEKDDSTNSNTDLDISTNPTILAILNRLKEQEQLLNKQEDELDSLKKILSYQNEKIIQLENK